MGTSVAIQNQTGRCPNKWDKTGGVVENQPLSKVLVQVDGSRRITIRNRRFVKVILPPLRNVKDRVNRAKPRKEADMEEEDKDE